MGKITPMLQKIQISFVSLVLLLSVQVFPQRVINHDYPRIATLNWGGGTADWLSRYDLILGSKSDSLLYKSVKGINGSVYVLATDDWNIGGPFYQGPVPGNLPAEWRLRRSDGSYVTVYGKYYYADVTEYCGLYNGERYNQALPRRLMEETAWATYDGVSSNGSWVDVGDPDIDLDRNGVNDRTEHGNAWVKQKWQGGQNRIRSTLRELYKAKWGNPNEKFIFYWTIIDTMCISVANGVGWENMYMNYPPRFSDWVPLINKWSTIGVKPRINLVTADIVYDAGHAPDRHKDYHRFVRWGLCTTLLHDSYFMSGDDRDHHWTNYYDEYDVKLGYPKGVAQQLLNGCWVRFFDNGVSIVNPTNTTQTVTSSDLTSLSGYSGPYYRFRGNQDPVWNDGSLFTSVVLISTRASYRSTQYVGDGIILVKKPTAVVSDIIIDNAYCATSPGSSPATFTGFTVDRNATVNYNNPTWYNFPGGYTSAEYYKSYYASSGDGSAKAIFKPTINVTGKYRVYEWHGWRGSYSSSYREGTNVPCTVVHQDGSTTITVDQTVNSGKWNLLGTFNFNSGGNYSATLSNNANGYVIADAFMFEYSGEGQMPPPPPEQISPPNGAVNQPIPLTIRWKSVAGAQRYSFQIATDINFQNLIVNNSSLTDTTRQISSLAYSTLYYWRLNTSNTNGTSVWSSIFTFRTHGNLSISGKVYYDVNNNRSLDSGDKGMAGWKVYIQGPRNDTIQVDSSGFFGFFGLPIGDYTLRQFLLPGWTQNYPPAFYSGRLDTGNTSAMCNFLNFAPDIMKCNVIGEWNMVSLPVNVSSNATTDVFPSADSKSFAFQGSYVFTDNNNLEFGRGYWISFPYPHDIWIPGSSVSTDTVELSQGWNIIGSLSYPIPVYSLQTIPPGLITSYVFAYNGSNYATDSIHPGGGYWLKSAADGKIVLSTSNQASYKLNDDLALFQKMNSLTFSVPNGRHQELYFTPDENLQVCVLRSQLPPPLPDNFDARFQSKEDNGTLISYLSRKENQSGSVPIVLRSPLYPLTITWICTDAKTQYRLITDDGETYTISAKGEVVLKEPRDGQSNATRVFVLEAVGGSDIQLPAVFEVTQNFPNPFNNGTSVTISLPAPSRVKLDVYNVLGEHVVLWLDRDMAAGKHQLHFDASNLSSGIYFYRIASYVSGGKVESIVKRMILLK